MRIAIIDCLWTEIKRKNRVGLSWFIEVFLLERIFPIFQVNFKHTLILETAKNESQIHFS